MKMRSRYKRFKLSRKIIRVFKWVTRHTRNSSKYKKLDISKIQSNKTISKLCKWGRNIKQGILNPGSKRGYLRVGHEPGLNTKPVHVPKGHLAIYVGEPDGVTHRVLVPVLFVNHPLFEKLLKEAEDVYGFGHSGRIMVPCPISEFENVKSQIAAAGTKCQQAIPACLSSLECMST